MTDLYDVLGVSRTAPHSEIRAAYRRRAAKMHPDVGGDTTAFQALTQAHDILSDPAKRARYDETGRVDDQPDNDMSYALEALSSAFNAVVMNLVKAGHRDFASFDMVLQMERHLTAERHRLQNITEVFAAEIVSLTDIITRFTVSDDGENLIAGLLRAQLAMLVEKAQEPEVELKATLGAIKELERYTFEKKVHPLNQLFVPWSGGQGVAAQAAAANPYFQAGKT